MGRKNKDQEELNSEVEEVLEDDGIVDASNFEAPARAESDPLEKEEREEAKKNAKPAPSGEYIVNDNMKVDGKQYKKGDVYEGKLYQDLIDAKALVKKA